MKHNERITRLSRARSVSSKSKPEANSDKSETKKSLGQNIINRTEGKYKTNEQNIEDCNVEDFKVHLPDYNHLKVALSSHSGDVKKYIYDLRARNHCLFRTWLTELLCGFSVLLYGYGSKMNLMKEFSYSFLGDMSLLVVYGFSASANLPKFLETLISTVPSFKESNYKSHLVKIKSVVDYYNSSKVQPLCIVIHNIDGPPLRNERFQWVLGTLAASRSIFVIASIDHINANTLWDYKLERRFNWRRHEVPTFESYITEITFSNPSTTHNTVADLRSAVTVLRCLTPAACSIFRILIEHQISSAHPIPSDSKKSKKVKRENTKIKQKSKITGMPYSSLLQKCLEMLLISDDSSLRLHLQEFRDHGLVSFTKLTGSSEQILTVPLPESDLVNLFGLNIWL